MPELDWAIVGGGLHGAFLARRLRQTGAGEPTVFDPESDPLAAWRRRAAACGMDHLRSPAAHHLGGPGDGLLAFAHAQGYDTRHLLGRYRRPSRALFEAHAAAALAANATPRIPERVTHLARLSGGWRLHTHNGHYRARRVLLAPGPPPVRRPAWATGMPHLFDPVPAAAPADGEIAVIGGGISAAQAALAFAGAGRRVWLVSRGPIRQATFDSEPCYAGPRCMVPFAAARDPRHRRRLIRAARRPGSLPPDIHARLAAALAEGRVRLVRGEIAGLGDAGPTLADGRRLRVDTLRLATGFEDVPPGGRLLRDLIEEQGPPLAPCGFPRPAENLEWLPGLFVAGRLAELVLGPMAGNIRGARAAAERLARAADTDIRRAAAALP
ncbi:hypothetical protein PC39_02537 [Salinisphaera sp. PC39]|uniref:FAD/NAD(P)-binding protein n=1 Tax=Salinisphaera sp. PC39 TaxID=1304156 RepID=UPI0033413BA1